MPIDRDKFFDAVRDDPFSGKLDQDQVDGMEAMLTYWEDDWEAKYPDPRWLAYNFATTFHETGQTMQAIEEWGKGEGKSYGEKDPETGETYYGRGLVQLTWRDNYAKATKELALEGDDDLEWHAEQALEPDIATAVLFEGCRCGWFTGRSLDDYFNDTKDDPVNARQIVNGNDCDDLIAGYYADFLAAIQQALVEDDTRPVATEERTVQVVLRVQAGAKIEVVGAALVIDRQED